MIPLSQSSSPCRVLRISKPFYPVGAEEDCTAKTYHELSIVTGKATDLQTSMALSLLKSTLLDSESSALRRALMDAGVGQIINGSYTSSMYQPVFSIRASGSEKDLRDKFISVIYKTLQDITINGIDEKAVGGQHQLHGIQAA